MKNNYKKPHKFDRNLIVIGAGSAGLVSSYIAAAVKAKVTLIEKHKMGGDCLNTGCVPSKALIRSAKILAQARRANEFGFKRIDVEYDFAEVMQRIQRVISTIEPHDSIERYTELGVECIQGEARITSPYSVEVNGQTLTTRSIIIATGARPFVPPIPGIEDMAYLTSDNVWQITELPKRMVVLGGGPIGSELTQCFARFGNEVTQVEMLPRILMREDPEVSEIVKRQFEQDGVRVLVEHTAKSFRKNGDQKIIVCERDGKEIEIEFDALLVAVGRKPNVTGFGLEDLDIPTNGPGTVQTNEYLQTVYPNIFACGDVAGPFQFTHTAAHQAWYASVNALFGRFKKFKADYSVIPWATFTDPEVARVGLNETEAKEQGIDYEVSKYGIDDLDRAIADEEAHGFVKVLTVPGKDKILGATIVGDHAGELITEYISAMRHDLGMNKILGTIHIYPTLSEANKFTAGIWKKAHAPEGLLKMVEWFHKFQRG
jgi:dihydrolipoamide dehydrogenase